MSTILKSLKRLEKEKESAAVQEPLLLSTTSTRHVMQRAARGAWLKSRRLQWGALTLLLVAGALFLFADNRTRTERGETPAIMSAGKIVQDRVPPAELFHPETNRPASTRIKPEAIPETPLADLRKPAFNTVLPSDEVPSRPSDASEALARKPAPSTIGRPEILRTPLPHAVNPPVAATRTAPPEPPTAVLPQMASGSQAPTLPAPHESSGPPDASFEQKNHPYADAERMTDGRLKVMAIVWSASPEERMAVINSRIVREGAVVDGFSIIAIGDDGVYVNEGGRMLKVAFGKP